MNFSINFYFPNNSKNLNKKDDNSKQPNDLQGAFKTLFSSNFTFYKLVDFKNLLKFK